jgi:hypothetical protein
MCYQQLSSTPSPKNLLRIKEDRKYSTQKIRTKIVANHSTNRVVRTSENIKSSFLPSEAATVTTTSAILPLNIFEQDPHNHNLYSTHLRKSEHLPQIYSSHGTLAHARGTPAFHNRYSDIVHRNLSIPSKRAKSIETCIMLHL